MFYDLCLRTLDVRTRCNCKKQGIGYPDGTIYVIDQTVMVGIDPRSLTLKVPYIIAISPSTL